jgi:intraflagellar transport protein 88
MVASCQRRIGNFQKALKIYQAIYQEYPDNIECLRFLVLLCKDMGLDFEEYARELRRVELENEAQGQYLNDDIRNIN